MEVASSQQHNQQTHHHHHYLHHNQQPHHNQRHMLSSTSTPAAGGARSPFQREVREWQRIDPNTGALLSGRLEADRWVTGPLGSYNKVSILHIKRHKSSKNWLGIVRDRRNAIYVFIHKMLALIWNTRLPIFDGPIWQLLNS